MRLSVIFLVAVAFVACLDSTAAASDANIVAAVTPTNVHESIASNRFLRARNEDDYPVKDESDEEDGDDEKENDEEEERMFSYFSESATALKAFKKLVAQSGDDLVTAISNLQRSEMEALFNQGQSQMAKMVPGFHPGMSLDDFGTAVKSAGVSDDMEDALVVGYGKYLAYQM
ncbi:hypothetical protein V7S43_001907 [Phytophthora oleae]|uniref:RxLR effector protein n=1 Tax=Phytophthora oleae TaxID=2107226 RepID=A0ABD3G1W8_9STRA